MTSCSETFVDDNNTSFSQGRIMSAFICLYHISYVSVTFTSSSYQPNIHGAHADVSSSYSTTLADESFGQLAAPEMEFRFTLYSRVALMNHYNAKFHTIAWL